MMKRTYDIVLCLLSVLALAWFLPWLGNLVFPQAVTDPFVSYSPVSRQMIVADNSGEVQCLFSVDEVGRETMLTKEERDSLLPQLFYTQLMARQAMPDSLHGVEMTVANLRQNQWVFTSSPREVNRPQARLYPMMESMPARFELEDPKEVFSLDGRIEFIEMATGKINAKRSRRFTDALARKGFVYPARSASANITSRKNYDEGYLMADRDGRVFHMKMQVGQPYVAKVPLPDSVVAEHVFIMENPDQRLVGLVADAGHNLYAIEREGYRPVMLPVGQVNPEVDRITIIKDAFNWVVKVNTNAGACWIALDSRTYERKADYRVDYEGSRWDEISAYVFPFSFSVTGINDCYVCPRFADFSWRALALNVLLVIVVGFALRRAPRGRLVWCVMLTLALGIFFLIPLFVFRPV